MELDNWKCRCSSLGKIISKSGKLTDTVKSFLLEKFVEQISGIKKEAFGMALDKGIATEPESFKCLNNVFYPKSFIKKETEEVSNSFLTGTADTIPDEYVNDVKSAYTIFSFHQGSFSHDWEWQLRGYMFLYDKPKARLFYCLNNMPDYMIAEEQRRMFYNQKKWATMDNEDYIEACIELEKANKYDHIPLEEKFKFWEIDRDLIKEEQLIASVMQARNYLAELLKEHRENIKRNKEVLNKKTNDILAAS